MRSGKRLRAFSSKKSIGQWMFTSDSRSLTMYEGNTIHLYEISSGKEISSFVSPLGSHELIFSRDGRKLAAFWGTCILLYDVISGRLVHAPVGHSWFLRQIRFFPDGKHLVSHTSMRGEIIVWDIASARPVATHASGELQSWIVVADKGEEIYFLPWKDRRGEIEDPRFEIKTNPNGKSPRFPEPDNLKIYCWEWKTNRVQQEIVTKTSRVYDDFVRSPNGRHGQNYSGITYSADGRCVVLSNTRLSNTPLCIREVASGKDRLQLPAGGRRALSPNGRFLACTGQGGGVRVFSTATGKVLADWHSEEGTSEALAVNSDSRLLATGGYDGTLLVWKLPESDGLPASLSPEEAATFWHALADNDAARTNRALAGLAAAPAQAIPLIKERFPTWKKPDGKQITRRIAELDNDSFSVREQATRELFQTGSDAAAALHQALAKSPSPEARRRIDDLLRRLGKGPSPGYLRALRAIEVLERIGTLQARDVLRMLKDKPLSPELHMEIQASLQRLLTRP